MFGLQLGWLLVCHTNQTFYYELSLNVSSDKFQVPVDFFCILYQFKLVTRRKLKSGRFMVNHEDPNLCYMESEVQKYAQTQLSI